MKNFLDEYTEQVRLAVRELIRDFFPDLLTDEELIAAAKRNPLWQDPTMMRVAAAMMQAMEEEKKNAR